MSYKGNSSQDFICKRQLQTALLIVDIKTNFRNTSCAIDASSSPKWHSYHIHNIFWLLLKLDRWNCGNFTSQNTTSIDEGRRKKLNSVHGEQNIKDLMNASWKTDCAIFNEFSKTLTHNVIMFCIYPRNHYDIVVSQMHHMHASFQINPSILTIFYYLILK